MPQLTFTLPDGTVEQVDVTALYNAGYAGRKQDEVAAHIAELAELGVPAPHTTPTLYPIAPYLAQQTDEVFVQHARTSGEAEWALIVTAHGVLLTVACDHTDRALEAHGVAWSKNAAPDVLGSRAWRLRSAGAGVLARRACRAWCGQARDGSHLGHDLDAAGRGPVRRFMAGRDGGSCEWRDFGVRLSRCADARTDRLIGQQPKDPVEALAPPAHADRVRMAELLQEFGVGPRGTARHRKVAVDRA